VRTQLLDVCDEFAQHGLLVLLVEHLEGTCATYINYEKNEWSEYGLGTKVGNHQLIYNKIELRRHRSYIATGAAMISGVERRTPSHIVCVPGKVGLGVYSKSSMSSDTTSLQCNSAY
jgi:hypothetical protein